MPDRREFLGVMAAAFVLPEPLRRVIDAIKLSLNELPFVVGDGQRRWVRATIDCDTGSTKYYQTSHVAPTEDDWKPLRPGVLHFEQTEGRGYRFSLNEEPLFSKKPTPSDLEIAGDLDIRVRVAKGDWMVRDDQ